MIVIKGETGRDVLFHATRKVMEWGRPIGPRGLATRELLGARLEIEKPWDAYPSEINRPALSPALYAAEAAMIVGGVSIPQMLERIAPFYSNFINDDGLLDGAYGPRLHEQLCNARVRLSKDRDSRQAVVSLWNHEDAGDFKTKDLPCTVNVHFLIRNDELLAYVTMRSNDVFLGVPYDVGMFTNLQLAMARSLGVRPGLYSHSSNSLHLYERDVPKANQLVPPPTACGRHPMSDGFGHTRSKWSTIADRARAVLRGELPDRATESEIAMRDVLLPYVDTNDRVQHERV